MRERTISIDINSKSFKTLKYKQYDHNNILNIVLKKDKQLVDWSSYTTRGFFELPDKTVIQRNLNVEKSTISIILEDVILEQNGKVILEIVLSNGEQIVTTFSIYLDIEKSIDRNVAIEGNPQWDIIKDGLAVLDNKVSHSELIEQLEDLKINFTPVQSDWNETNTTSSSYILNKPDMNTYATKSFVDETLSNAVSGGAIDLSGYAKIEDVGIKDSLTTNEKGNLVGAINEISDKAKNNEEEILNKAEKSQVEDLDEKLETYYYDKDTINNNYYTKKSTDEKLSDYYNKTNLDDRFNNYYTKTDVDTRLEGLDLSGSGGILIVENETERDELEDVETGEICYVKGKDEYYKYKDGIWEVFSSGNGSGGGISEITLSANTSTELNVSTTDTVNVGFNFNTTGLSKNGRLNVLVNGIVIKTEKITAGNKDVDVTKYLSKGENTVEINVTDTYGSSDFIIFTINVIELKLSSTFDYTQIFNGEITIPYVTNGNISKTLHVLVDNKEVYTEIINTSGTSKNCLLSTQTHGEHVIKMYVDCTLNEKTITSNTLTYHVICIQEGNTTPIIASSFNIKNVDQYTVLSIPYMVYTPDLLTSDVELYINENLYSSLNVDRKLQKWNLSDYNSGELKLKIKTGSIYKEFVLSVKEVILKTTEKTEGLQLYLTSKNRINDTNKENWSYNDITTTFTNFTWVKDGWQLDEEGYNALLIQNNARATINFKPFETDFKGTGKAIEFEFKVKDVIDYDAIVISCMSGNRGIEVGCKSALFKSNETSIITKFKEDERIRIAFSIESKNQNRLIYIYINGILSGLAQYVDTDIFSQSEPVNITLGNENCKLYLYNIRVYNEALGVSDALNNYIFDMNDMSKKIELIAKNDVYDDYGEISYTKLLNKIPCMIITGELPPVKGDKKKVDILYTNKADETRNFTDTNVTIDIQGTSSQYYPKKNYKIKLNNDYKLRETSVKGKVFCLKAD